MERNVRVFTSFVRNLSRYGKKAIFPKTNKITWTQNGMFCTSFKNFFRLIQICQDLIFLRNIKNNLKLNLILKNHKKIWLKFFNKYFSSSTLTIGRNLKTWNGWNSDTLYVPPTMPMLLENISWKMVKQPAWLIRVRGGFTPQSFTFT